jgi:hypothetical protein
VRIYGKAIRDKINDNEEKHQPPRRMPFQAGATTGLPNSTSSSLYCDCYSKYIRVLKERGLAPDFACSPIKKGRERERKKTTSR